MLVLMNTHPSISGSDIDAPLSLHRECVQPDWIDYNGHMNLAYYMLAFDHATDKFFDFVGLGETYMKAKSRSTFTLEAHITYDRELMLDAPMRIETQLLDYDEKRLHYMHFMYHDEVNFLASSNELISLHVNMKTRRSAPMPLDVLAQLDRIAFSHKTLARPQQSGRVISIAR